MQETARWPGTQIELRELTDVVERHCSCALTSTGKPRATCAAHRMLRQDQRALNGLVFERHIVDRLKHEEFSTSSVLIDAVGAHSNADSVPRGKPRPRVAPILAGVVLMAVGVGVVCAQIPWLMSVGLLLMVCGVVLIALTQLTDCYEPRIHSVPIAPSPTCLDALQRSSCG